jgi:glycosyltransferase involved in cell wall biosynthesis
VRSGHCGWSCLRITRQTGDDLKIAMLTNVVAPDKVGGLERYVRELAAGLARSGDDVEVVAKALTPHAVPREVGEDGVVIFRYPVPQKTSWSYGLRYPREVAKVVERHYSDSAPDMIWHAHFPVPAIPLAVRRRHYVYTFHAPVHKELLKERQGSYLLPWPIQRATVGILRQLEALVVRRAAAVICLSEFTRAEALSLGVDPARIHLLPGGVQTAGLAPAQTRVCRTDLASGPVLFSARRLVARTGVEELVRAIALVRNQLPGVRLAVAGDGPRRPYIQGLISDLDLEDVVCLLGRVSESELGARYQDADICVTPTQELEGFGLSTAEAMASGGCPLVTPVGANAEVVRRLGPGYVTDGASPAQIAAGIVRLWQDVDARTHAARCAADVAAEYDWRVVVPKMRALYSAALASDGVNDE